MWSSVCDCPWVKAFSSAFQLLLDIFRKVAKGAIDIHNEKLQKKEEAERKRQETLKKKLEAEKSDVVELTDAEAEELQKQLDEKKK